MVLLLNLMSDCETCIQIQRGQEEEEEEAEAESDDDDLYGKSKT